MSNLLKFNAVICKEEEARIINSNEIVEAKIKELAKAENYVEGDNYDNEFVEGISADKVELLLEEQEEEYSVESIKEQLEEAERKAQEIIQKAEEDAQTIKAQAMEEGKKKGYDQGYAIAMTELEEHKAVLEQECQQRQAEMDKKASVMEAELADTILEVIEGVLHTDLDKQREIVFGLLNNTLMRTEKSHEYNIHVSKEEYDYIFEKQMELQELLPEDAQLTIIKDEEVNAGQCLIETDSGVYDCGMDTQLEALKRDIKALARR